MGKTFTKVHEESILKGERKAEKELIQSELKEMYKGLNQLVDEILWNDWDPKGVKDVGAKR